MRPTISLPAALVDSPVRPLPPQARVYHYTMPGLDGPLEPHIKFVFQRRLEDALKLLDPPLAIPDDPCPMRCPARVTPMPAFKLDIAAAARRAQLEQTARHGAALTVRRGGAFDPALIEDREYDLAELVGPESRFRLRLVPSVGAYPRVIIAEDKSLVGMLGGHSHRNTWHKEVVEPATQACQDTIPHIVRSPEEVAHNSSPTLHGGIGMTFNEEPTEKNSSVVLNALIFFELLSFFAMKKLVGYGNRLLQTFCPTAFNALWDEKVLFLENKPDLLYPTSSSVFSALTFELGGHHSRYLAAGHPHRRVPGGWNILTALGKYSPIHGGHIILWEFGFVCCLAPGATVLLPAGVVNYSFVRVRPHETRYLVIQWAGPGIPRWFRNGYNLDSDFAVKASEEQHRARKERRQLAHSQALDAFPLEEELQQEAMRWRLVDTNAAAAVAL
ncbi:hypothetical protein C8F04DRAFT_1192255 [Mycena alexandri]|uniref:Uncharacterized protein n=1 Tax=Mycena alexandri TaxID=1745969 RepID=A0AAD6SBA5_9AGAR|nr:hypothetical protein C8F04DRAFT_1192255 [Mycena alexandri]